eukprot:70646_1
MFDAKQHLQKLTIHETKCNSSQQASLSHTFTPTITCTPCTPSSFADDTFSSRSEFILPPQLDNTAHLSLKSLSSLPSLAAHPYLGYSNGSNQSLHSQSHLSVYSNLSSSHTIQLAPSETALTPNVTATAPMPNQLTNHGDNFSLDTVHTSSRSKAETVCKDESKTMENEIAKRSSITYNDSKEDEKSTEPTTITYCDESEDDDPPRAASVFDDPIDMEQLFLAQQGYKRGKQIAVTLQGFVYELECLTSGTKYVVKQTDKQLHAKGITIQNGKKYAVKEDVLKERDILQRITKRNSPSYMVKFIDFFESHDYYYLVMEHGGSDLFEFVVQAHEHIKNGSLSIKEWRKFVKYIFWQMCVLMLWLHNTARATHLDVSLENMLVQNARFINKGNGELSISTNIEIKFCDFGLAQLHDVNADNVHNGGYMSTKYCGKTNYKSPQVYRKKGAFDGRKADVWSLGVVLFCLAVGAPPYQTPNKRDACYADFIEKGRIAPLLFQWKRHHYVTERMLSLLQNLLKRDEKKRFVMDDVVQHPWLRSYYTRYEGMIKHDLLRHMWIGCSQ